MAWEPDYLTLQEFKDFLNIKADDTKDDAQITRAITAASRAIDLFCSSRPNGMGSFRQFGKVATTESRFYTPQWSCEQARWIIEIDDVVSAVGMVVEFDLDNDDVYEEVCTNYVLRPRDAAVNNRPYTQIAVGVNSSVQPYQWPDSARVTTDQWGWAAFPTTVVEACALQTNRFNKRRRAPFKETGNSSSGTDQSVNNIRQLDPDIESMLEPYIKLSVTS